MRPISDVPDNTGLASGAQEITCIGSASADAELEQLSHQPGVDSQRAPTAPRASSAFALTQNFLACRRTIRRSSRRRGAEVCAGRAISRRKCVISFDLQYSLNQHQASYVDRNSRFDARVHARRRRRTSGLCKPRRDQPRDRCRCAERIALLTRFCAGQPWRRRSRSRRIPSRSRRRRAEWFHNSLSGMSAGPRCASTTKCADSAATPCAIPCSFQWGRSSGDIQHQINFSLTKAMSQELTLSVSGQFRNRRALHAHRRRRCQRRRLVQRSRVRVQSVDGHGYRGCVRHAVDSRARRSAVKACLNAQTRSGCR